MTAQKEPGLGSSPKSTTQQSPEQTISPPTQIQQTERVGQKKLLRAKKKAERQKAIAAVKISPPASLARMRGRHWGGIISFFLMVVTPFILSTIYMMTFAENEYVSKVGFTVRKEDSASGDLLGGLATQLVGGSAQSDTDILFEFIQSQDLANKIDAVLDLKSLYSKAWPKDWVFALKPHASIEELTHYWKRIVKISYDQSTGLVELNIRAFQPETSPLIGIKILEESQNLINELNVNSRTDTLRYAESDLAEAQERLKTSREALVLFRSRTQIVDPITDLQGRMGVINNLQQQLAESLIELDMLKEGANSGDPRIVQAERRTDVIRARIRSERNSLSAQDGTDSNADYPSLIAEYEGLVVEREFAEHRYTTALAGLDVARASASRQTRYLAVYMEPTIPQTSEYPRRFIILGLTAVFLLLGWSVLALVYYSIRDSR